MSKKNKKREKFNLLMEFYNSNNRWPKKEEYFEGKKIGKFAYQIKNNSIKLTSECFLTLSKNNFFTDSMRAFYIHKKVLLLIKFFESFGRWPKSKEEFKGVKIGYFMKNVKFGNTSISQEDRVLLEKKGFNF